MPPFNLGIGSWKSTSSSKPQTKDEKEKEVIYNRALDMNRENLQRKLRIKQMDLRRKITEAQRSGNTELARKLERELNTSRRG
ncbi:hypothetical protein IT409_00280 [Candidatus Falkowbacteria bacterium]|nr:hypothetical protein [Candidatus Falkowbacteria bacterium]